MLQLCPGLHGANSSRVRSRLTRWRVPEPHGQSFSLCSAYGATFDNMWQFYGLSLQPRDCSHNELQYVGSEIKLGQRVGSTKLIVYQTNGFPETLHPDQVNFPSLSPLNDLILQAEWSIISLNLFAPSWAHRFWFCFYALESISIQPFGDIHVLYILYVVSKGFNQAKVQGNYTSPNILTNTLNFNRLWVLVLRCLY